MKLKIVSNQVKTEIVGDDDQTDYFAFYHDPDNVDEQAILLIGFLYANIPGVVVEQAMKRLGLDYEKYRQQAELNSEQNSQLIANNVFGE